MLLFWVDTTLCGSTIGKRVMVILGHALITNHILALCYLIYLRVDKLSCHTKKIYIYNFSFLV